MPREKRISPDDFNFLKVLGKGNYGKVMLATLKTDTTNQYYAIKVIKKSALIDDESLEHVLAENRVLQQIDHPFLVKLHYSFQTPVRLFRRRGGMGDQSLASQGLGADLLEGRGGVRGWARPC